MATGPSTAETKAALLPRVKGLSATLISLPNLTVITVLLELTVTIVQATTKTVITA